jgi:hypothetical protein
MRRALAIIAAFLLLSAPAAGSATDYQCTKGDIESLIHAGPQAVKLHLFMDKTQGPGGAWKECQFRLYDDNDDEASPDDPEVPHIFSANDWFLGGVLFFLTRDEWESMGLDRDGAIDWLEQGSDQLFWAKKGESLTEVSLEETSYRNAVPDSSFGLLVVKHRYHLFEAGSLQPGTYEWRWVLSHPSEPELFVAAGDVVIVPG